MGCIPLYSYRMADTTLIESLAKDIIMALDKYYSPEDIITGFDDALEAYEELVNTYNQTK